MDLLDFITFFGYLCAMIDLGSMLLHTTNDNQLMKKNLLILWNFSSIQMRILNGIGCTLNWIEFLDWIELDSNS